MHKFLFLGQRTVAQAALITVLAACGGAHISAAPVQCGLAAQRADAGDGEAGSLTDTACSVMQNLNLRSALIQVSVDGRPVYSVALGESAPGVPATVDMHFRNGAVAMTYMSTVLLQLADENKLSLNDKIGKWRPDLPASDQVTLKMLLNMTSGYPDYVVDPEFLDALMADRQRAWTGAALLSHAFSKEPVYPPGSNWNYSHTNYVILGDVIEKTTGKPLADVIAERILAPLKLRNTASADLPDIPSPVLRAYTSEYGSYEESTLWNPSWTLPAGAVMTTDIADLLASAEAIMDGRLLSPAAYAVQTGRQSGEFGDPSACPPGICRRNTDRAHYGMGLLASGPWLLQGVLFNGYSASIGMLPERKISIAVAATIGPDANPDRNGSEMLMFAIARHMAPDSPVPLSDGAQ